MHHQPWAIARQLILLFVCGWLISCAAPPQTEAPASAPNGVTESLTPPPPESSTAPSPAPKQERLSSVASPGTPTEPNQDDLAMTCAGKIQDSLDFTASYSREAGFSRVEFRPAAAPAPLVANLSYTGKNDKNQGVWRGNVKQMADVVLTHLSTAAPQEGDQVSVEYDGRVGTATCQ